jgi:hypothetical protein
LSAAGGDAFLDVATRETAPYSRVVGFRAAESVAVVLVDAGEDQRPPTYDGPIAVVLVRHGQRWVEEGWTNAGGWYPAPTANAAESGVIAEWQSAAVGAVLTFEWNGETERVAVENGYALFVRFGVPMDGPNAVFVDGWIPRGRGRLPAGGTFVWPPVLARLVHELVARGFDQVDQGYSAESFGNRLLTLRRDALAVTLTKDRGEWFVWLAALHGRAKRRNIGYDVALWDAVVTGAAPQDARPLADEVEMILARVDDYAALAAGDLDDLEARLSACGQMRFEASQRLIRTRAPWGQTRTSANASDVDVVIAGLIHDDDAYSFVWIEKYLRNASIPDDAIERSGLDAIATLMELRLVTIGCPLSEVTHRWRRFIDGNDGDDMWFSATPARNDLLDRARGKLHSRLGVQAAAAPVFDELIKSRTPRTKEALSRQLGVAEATVSDQLGTLVFAGLVRVAAGDGRQRAAVIALAEPVIDAYVELIAAELRSGRTRPSERKRSWHGPAVREVLYSSPRRLQRSAVRQPHALERQVGPLHKRVVVLVVVEDADAVSVGERRDDQIDRR